MNNSCLYYSYRSNELHNLSRQKHWCDMDVQHSNPDACSWPPKTTQSETTSPTLFS